MVFDFAKVFFRAVTAVAVLSANGETTFSCKAFQAKLEFNVKLTVTPARADPTKTLQRGSSYRVHGPFTSPYHALLFANHADEGKAAHQQLDRLRDFMRARRIIYSPTFLKK